MSRTRIVYKDYAVGSDKAATVTGTYVHSYSDLSMIPFGVSAEPLASTEENYWVLDGSRKLYDDQQMGFLSSVVSGAAGAFSNYPVIQIDFSKQFTSLGITMNFDVDGGTFPTDIHVAWYQSGSLLDEGDFAPDATTYYVEQTVEHYDKVIITFKSMNLPYTRLRVQQILMGADRTFYMNEIRDAKITMEMSLISAMLPVNTLTWTLDSMENIQYIFQLKQPVLVYSDNTLIGVFYISGSSRKSKNVYQIQCEDILGILDTTPYAGITKLAGINSKELVDLIIDTLAEIEYDNSSTLAYSGLILAGTVRSALQQALFGWGVCCTTDGRDGLKIFTPPSSGETIPADRVYTGGSVETDALVTRVEVTSHRYTQSSSGLAEVGGTRYNDAKTIYSVDNPDVTASDRNNVKEVKDATMVYGQAQNIAQRVYDYYQRRNKAKAKIVWNGERLGDFITIPNAWGDSTSGNIEKMEIVLSNTVAATVTVR